MKKISAQELAEMLCPPEGEIIMVAGTTGAGKGYLIAKWIDEDLRNGIPVHSTMPFLFDGYSELDNKVQIFFSLLFPWRNFFINVDKDNFHFIPRRELSAAKLKEIYGGNLYIDEGQFLLPSGFADRNMDNIELVTMTRHMYRRIVIVSQRFNSVNVNARDLVHRYYLCDKLLTWPFVVFRVTEYEKLKGGEVDLDSPSSRPKIEIASRRIFKSYKTHYWGEGRSAELKVTGFTLTYKERLQALVGALREDPYKKDPPRSAIRKV